MRHGTTHPSSWIQANPLPRQPEEMFRVWKNPQQWERGGRSPGAGAGWREGAVGDSPGALATASNRQGLASTSGFFA